MKKIILKRSSSILLTFFFILLIFFSQAISADVISINPGGGNESVMTGKYIEGFFSGIPEEAEEAPPEEEGEEEGGGGGGIPAYILVEPERFDESLIVNSAVTEVVKVTNLKTDSVTVNVRQENLDGIVTLGVTSLTIEPSQTVELGVFFKAPSEPGVYTGKIIIGNKLILVTLNVREGELLFDSNIAVLNENFEVPQQGILKTLVTLIPLGDPARLDITLNFTIKDYGGGIYLTKSETLLVEEQAELSRNFDIGNLPMGEYVIALELIYPSGVAPSSAHFKVIGQPPVVIIGKFILFLMILILLIAIAIIIILIIRKLRERKMQSQKTS